MTPETGSLITSRREFHDALRRGFTEVAQRGSRELWLSDEDFSQWPLGERAVVEDLTRWAAGGRRLTLVARHFDELPRRHPRWVEWRQTWSHLVSCRSNTIVDPGSLPTVFVGLETISIRLADAVHCRGRWSHQKADELHCRELIDAILQRSEEAFPAFTTGL